MTLEDAFVEAIKESPCDPAPRLIFADWLDEQGRNKEAEWLRLDVRVATSPMVDPRDMRRWQTLRGPRGVYPLHSEIATSRRREQNRRFLEALVG